MKYLAIALLLLSSCAYEPFKSTKDSCGKPTYNTNSIPCPSPYSCDPNALPEVRCDALHF